MVGCVCAGQGDSVLVPEGAGNGKRVRTEAWIGKRRQEGVRKGEAGRAASHSQGRHY